MVFITKCCHTFHSQAVNFCCPYTAAYGRKESVVILVLKPVRDRSQETSYSPISLTSCLCKTVEGMVNRRLIWVLENRNLLCEDRCGFRRLRSALDHLVSLEYHIQNAFLLRQHLVAVFFDLEKAYDTTWRYGILRTLHHRNVRFRLPLFLSHFPQVRYFLFRLWNVLSARYPQESGVQGSVLNVTLFALSINGLANAVGPSVTTSVVCGRRRLLLQFPDLYHHRTPASGRYQPSVSVGSGECFYIFSRQKCVSISHVRGVYIQTPACLWAIAFSRAVPHFFHLTFCTPTNSNLCFLNALVTVLNGPVL
jgi:hypothetical protein